MQTHSLFTHFAQPLTHLILLLQVLNVQNDEWVNSTLAQLIFTTIMQSLSMYSVIGLIESDGVMEWWSVSPLRSAMLAFPSYPSYPSLSDSSPTLHLPEVHYQIIFRFGFSQVLTLAIDSSPLSTDSSHIVCSLTCVTPFSRFMVCLMNTSTHPYTQTAPTGDQWTGIAISIEPSDW